MAISELVGAARARFYGEAAKSTAGIRAYVHSFVTSRVTMGLSLALAVAFFCTAIYAPYRLAPVGPVGLVQQGLLAPAPTLDLSNFDVSEADVRAKTSELRDEAKPYVQKAYEDALGKFPALPFWLNLAGGALSLALLAYTIKLQLRAARAS